ncbi:hypothetical protein F0562_028953 [Nyssa sinensis]|uniref:Uncharacterized protein n=1 Tax=Nyssa sinensis TaxID=561372 RepID=A0A5J5AZL2_9ASTE|nr:hypothetical protein F0562_028953 [Nyssa sinensis]
MQARFVDFTAIWGSSGAERTPIDGRDWLVGLGLSLFRGGEERRERAGWSESAREDNCGDEVEEGGSREEEKLDAQAGFGYGLPPGVDGVVVVVVTTVVLVGVRIWVGGGGGAAGDVVQAEVHLSAGRVGCRLLCAVKRERRALPK